MKQQLEETRGRLQAREADLEVERRKVGALSGAKELNLRLQLELREARQEREKLHETVRDLASEAERTG